MTMRARSPQVRIPAMRRLSYILLAGLFHTLHAHAEDQMRDAPGIVVSGFGTVGAVYHDKRDVEYRRDILQGSGATAGKLSFKPDSMLGLQLDGHLLPGLDATLQAIGRENWQNSYKPDVSMAYVKLTPSDGTFIRLGRLLIESYLQGDSAEIGYANLQVRQPITFAPRGFDGMDAETGLPFGEGVLRLKGSAGWTHGTLVASSNSVIKTDGSPLLQGLVEYMRQGWTWHLSVGRLKLHNEVQGLEDGDPFPTALLAVSPNGTAILDKLRQRGRQLHYWTLAAGYDQGPIQATASYSAVSSPHEPTQYMFYTSAGYRFDKITPYASLAVHHTDRDVIPTGIASGVGLDTFNQAIMLAQSGFLTNQTDMTVGTRYDFRRNMALKLQADRIRYRDPATILDSSLVSQPIETRPYQAFTLFSVALDFVF